MKRDDILGRLERDLAGPLAEDEILDARPSDVYLTGILWPRETRMGAEEDDRLGSGEEEQGTPNGGEEEIPLAGLKRPCAAGISFAVAPVDGAAAVVATAVCATYEQELRDGETTPKASSPWRRKAHSIQIGPIPCDVPSLDIDPALPPAGVTVTARTEHGIPAGLRLHVRSAGWEGKRLVTLTVINAALPGEGEGRAGIERATLFQVCLMVRPAGAARLVARPSRRAVVDDEDRSAALLYRHAREFAVGHTCSAAWHADNDASEAASVSTTWIPSAVVPAVSSRGHAVFAALADDPAGPLVAEWLASAADRDLENGLLRLVEAYREWIGLKARELDHLEPAHRAQGEANLLVCRDMARRMEEGARSIAGDPAAAAAFRLANRAMQLQFSWDPERGALGRLVWRPFQLGFFLLSVASLADRGHRDRSVMDLLWFPTGGGKTEAYLALIAFLAFHRRLRNARAPDDGAGVAAVMRYTLRLLTTQQFERAAAMILACEALRRCRVPGVPEDLDLGAAPFSIGLWVGGDATPNRFDDARRSLLGDQDCASPVQLVACPACRTQLRWTCVEATSTIEVRCPSASCVLHDPSDPLPVWTVDDHIYDRQPTLVIGTVDKFAQIVRRPEVNSLFALQTGEPPDLIIQDELHLISGPLGTVAGLYEAAIDLLFTRDGQRPKVIGSTATIRRASEQVLALFDRVACQFPPPGLDAADSGFAIVDPDAPGRLYAAVTTAGRSAKFALQATSASLLQSAAGAFATPAEADPYWTLIAYFNSLRELGGALVLMQDDVTDSIDLYAGRRGEPARDVKSVEELTSRLLQAEVRNMLGLLGTRAGEDGALDVVLASNMLSVGVDVPRLGLMLVNGQPKGIAEYIQATSRVGRRHPGLVVAVLNNAKARDRSHFEAFRTWHATLYRDVEATSVTPFASRARDRALHAALVAALRHRVPGLLRSPGIAAASRAAVDQVIDAIARRARTVDASEVSVKREMEERVAEWERRGVRQYWSDRAPRQSLLQSAERAATLRALGRATGEAWPTPNSMRNVEPSVHFRLAEALRDKTDKSGGGTPGNG